MEAVGASAACASILLLAENLGMEVVAEGIEKNDDPPGTLPSGRLARREYPATPDIASKPSPSEWSA